MSSDEDSIIELMLIDLQISELGVEGNYLDRVDSFAITFENEEPIEAQRSTRGALSFRPISQGLYRIPIDTHLVNRYNIYYYKHSVVDVDTLIFEHQAELDKCNDKRFAYFNIYYNEQLVAEEENFIDTAIRVQVSK